MILDTNALSAWWGEDSSMLAVIGEPERIFVPVPALAEFRFGILQSRLRETMEAWIERSLSTVEILGIDGATTFHYAELRLALKSRGTPIPMNDLWISAIARQHGLPILSRDTHFDLVPGISRVSW
jgi:predicted nucleic acid-binding protein